MLRQEIEVEPLVGIAEKHLLPPVAALGDMVGQIRNDDACEPSHGRWVKDAGNGTRAMRMQEA